MEGRKGKGWGKEGEEGVKEKEKERRGSFESFAELKTRGGEPGVSGDRMCS